MAQSPAGVGFEVQTMVEMRRVTAVTPSPCGTWLAVEAARLDADGAKYVSDLWKVPLDGGEAVQFTRGPSNDTAPCFRRDGALGFLSNRNPREGKPEDGDEDRSQVWLIPAGSGEPRPLTDEPLGVSAFRFAREADRLVVIADVLPDVPPEEQRERQAEIKKHGPSALRYTRTLIRYWDHWLEPAAPHVVAYDENGGERCDLTPAADREYRGASFDVARDGRFVVITRNTPGEDRVDDTAPEVIDLATGDCRVLGAMPLTHYGAPCLSRDGRRFAASRSTRQDEAVGKADLVVFEVSTGESRNLTAGWDRWAGPADWTADGRAIIALAADHGTTPLFLLDAESGRVTRLTAESAGGTHEAVSLLPDGETIVGIRSAYLEPPEAFRAPLRPGAVPERITSLAGMSAAEAAQAMRWEKLSVAADDGEAIEYFALRPAGSDGPLPTVLLIHGGPIGQWADAWAWRWNPLALVARGYTVLMPNPRGSTGRGQAFIEGIWGNTWGGQCYRDLMAVTDAAQGLPYVDPQRMAAMGGSFGGYMTNWIGGNTDRFRALVTHASLYSLPAFHGSTDIPVWFARHIGATPYDDPDAYNHMSPHVRIKNWKTPTLVIHGERDYRVPISEGLTLFEALQHHGVESEMLVFPDENHWILKPRNLVAWYAAILDFLDKHVKP